MAVDKQLTGIHVFRSDAQYNSNIENIKDTDISLIRDDNEYLTVQNLQEVKDELKGDKGDKGDPGQDGAPGSPGASGATFTPSMAEDGTLSWQNDKGLTNPDPVRIKPIIDDATIKNILLMAHPVGSYYQSDDPASPAVLFGGTWEAVRGVFLLAESDARRAGTTGGEESHTLSVDEMPEHGHGASTNSDGGHTHTASTNSTGEHSHTRGSMNITGKYSSEGLMRDIAKTDTSGALYESSHSSRSGWGYGGASYPLSKGIGFDASRNWTGSTSSNGNHSHTVTVNAAADHSHAVTVNNTVGGKAHNNMPPFKAVYTWRRTR